jgi:hypothetical protein
MDDCLIRSCCKYIVSLSAGLKMAMKTVQHSSVLRWTSQLLGCCEGVAEGCFLSQLSGLQMHADSVHMDVCCNWFVMEMPSGHGRSCEADSLHTTRDSAAQEPSSRPATQHSMGPNMSCLVPPPQNHHLRVADRLITHLLYTDDLTLVTATVT